MRTRHTAALGVIAALALLAVACAVPPASPGTPNLNPVAVATAAPTAGVAPLQVQFSGAASVDPDGSITAYAWTFGDGASASGAEPTHTYTEPGDYQARLTVTDNRGATASTTVVIEVARDLSDVVLVDDGGADGEGCGTLEAPCATIEHALDLAVAGERSAVWVADGDYPAFRVRPGVHVRGGYDATFSAAAGESRIDGAFDPVAGVSAAIVARDVDVATTLSGLHARGADESAAGRAGLAAHVSGSGNGLQFDGVSFTGGPTGAEAGAVVVDGATQVRLTDPDIASGDAAGFGHSSYGLRVLNNATVTVEGGQIEAGAGAPGAPATGAPGTAAAGCTGPNGANATGPSSPGNGGSACSGTTPSNSGAGGRGGNYSGSGVAGSPGGGGAAGGNGGCGSLFGCGTDAGGGAAGAAGAAGSSGTGASAAFTAGALFSGATGAPGTAGVRGHGGGGGGGGKSASASGGGGGAGGGGGNGGVAGTSGGAAGGGSFGVYAVNASVQLEGVNVTAGSGGAGAAGQPGGAGGAGGNGGNGGNKSCCEAGGGGGGGGGGAGGGGGGAGGGAGGPSIGVLHSGSGTLTVDASSLGAASGAASGGNGGAGGAAGTPGTGGDPGNCALIGGGCGGTGGSASQGNAGAPGAPGSAGAVLGSWSNGVGVAPDHTGTAPTTTTTTTTAPPQAVHTAVSMTCRTTASGQTSTDPNETGASVLAPASVESGSEFQVQLTPDPMSVPTSGGGYPIGFISNVRFSFAVPAGASFVAATYAGGSNIGTGTPSVALAGDRVTLTVPGNLAAGTTALFPTITVTFQAVGAPGSTIETRFAGSSYSDPGLIFQTRVNNVPLLGSVTSTSNCYAPVNPVLSSTAIV